ncbi:MAG: DoxX family protein [Bryobacteraceae bacterium]
MPATSKLVWTGRVISGLAVAFLLMDGAMKLWKPAPVVEATRQLGFPESDIVGIGVLLLACTLLHLVPRTAIFGAVLLTGYLGGAVASQLRAGNGWFNVLFPVIIGALIWLGASLRAPRARSVFS